LSNTEKVEALRFLIHFIGDVHQPLHVFDNHDRGGNEVPVAMEMSGVEGDHSSNLHAVWDREMVDQLGSDATAISEKVSGELTPSKRHAWSSGSAASWANESFAIARDEIYRRLSIRGREKIVLDRAYLVKEAPVVVVQIERASIRLAWVLNTAFKKAALPSKMLRASATISASAAGQHVGTIAAIVDVVVNVHRTRGGTIFLDFGGRYPANVFSAVIMPAHSSEFSNIEALTGQRCGSAALCSSIEASLRCCWTANPSY
jgi:S1/P1 Nuclease